MSSNLLVITYDPFHFEVNLWQTPTLGSPERMNNDCLIKAGAPSIVESITVALE
jgi:hypothetical protein